MLFRSIQRELVPSAKIVLITNGAGLLQLETFTFLHKAAGQYGLDIWLKLDAGTPLWYEKINRSGIPFEKLISKIKEFSACTPVTIQTMLCEVDGTIACEEEVQAWENLVVDLAAAASKNSTGSIRKVQLYGKARPAPEDPRATALPAEFMERRACSLRKKLSALSTAPSVEIFL